MRLLSFTSLFFFFALIMVLYGKLIQNQDNGKPSTSIVSMNIEDNNGQAASSTNISSNSNRLKSRKWDRYLFKKK
jgi:hypothetical protein